MLKPRGRLCKVGVHHPSAPSYCPTPFTQAGKSRLEAGKAHPADDSLSGRAEDVGFVENIQHSPLVERLQVVPGERERESSSILAR